MGQQDGSLIIARKNLKEKSLITCHKFKDLANEAIGLELCCLWFIFKSKLKPSAKKANLSILRWAKKY